MAAQGEHGQDVTAHGVADHAEALRRHAELAQDPGVRLGILLQHHLDRLEVVGDPRHLHLARLVDEIALGDQHQPMVADRKSTRLNSSHANSSYAVFCLKKKTKIKAATSTISIKINPNSVMRQKIEI